MYNQFCRNIKHHFLFGTRIINNRYENKYLDQYFPKIVGMLTFLCHKCRRFNGTILILFIYSLCIFTFLPRQICVVKNGNIQGESDFPSYSTNQKFSGARLQVSDATHTASKSN